MASLRTVPTRTAAALLAGPVVVLTALLDSLPTHIGRLANPTGATTFADLLVHLAVTVACAGSAWLLVLTALATVTSRWAPGSARRVARMTPKLWRDVVLTMVGVSALSGPAFAHAHTDRPADSDRQAVQVSGLRLPDRPSTHQRPERRARADVQTVTVRRGDTLWSIAGRAMPSDSTVTETAARCAAWYVANRQVIGDDPDLILPGMSLQPPLPPDEGPS